MLWRRKGRREAPFFFGTKFQEYSASRPRPPFHKEARRAAGFSDVELCYLETDTD